jgi:hypothetical protein
MILYMRTQRTGMPRLALAAAALVTGLAAWWLSSGAPSSGAGPEEPAAVRPAAVAPRAELPPPAAPLPRPTAAAEPPAPPMQYVGQWMEGSRRAVVLSYQGRSVIVRVPGRVDDRYEVVSADDRELVLRDIAAASTQRIGLGGTAIVPQAVNASGTSAPAAAVEAPAAPVAVPSGKLPPPSKRTSDEYEPEN